MGDEYGIFSCSSSACASSSYKGLVGSVHGVRKTSLLASITFCTRPAISCVKASFRAADCCSTRIAPSRESFGKGGSTTGILKGVEQQ